MTERGGEASETPPQHKHENGASGQVRSDLARRDAHVQAEIIAASQQQYKEAARNDEEEEQREDAEQRKMEEAAEAVAAEKRRMDAAATVKSSFVATAVRLPGPKV